MRLHLISVDYQSGTIVTKGPFRTHEELERASWKSRQETTAADRNGLAIWVTAWEDGTIDTHVPDVEEWRRMRKMYGG